MIQNNTARRLMYDWHGGQSSAFYAAASSGLCASFAALAFEVDTITDAADRQKLLTWIQRRQRVAPEVLVGGRVYRELPWYWRPRVR